MAKINHRQIGPIPAEQITGITVYRSVLISIEDKQHTFEVEGLDGNKDIKLQINGIEYLKGSDFSVSGKTIQWLATKQNGGFDLESNMIIEVIFGHRNNHVEESELPTIIRGKSNFGSALELVRINLDRVVDNIDYTVMITPTQETQGLLGEYGVSQKKSDHFFVFNTGRSTATFDYLVIF